VDFYDESELIWLEADATIRRESGGQRSLDDFCRRFHGGQSGAPAVVPYTFDDVVDTMNQVAAYDWRGFFTARLSSTAPHAPLGGLEGSGWRLVFTDVPNKQNQAREDARRIIDLRFSLGFIVRTRDDNGDIVDVIPGTPAAQAGIAPGMKLVAVNGRQWSPVVLHDAVGAAKGGSAPIELLIENAEYYKTYRVDYHGGERYPHLERDPARPDLLGQVIRSRVGASSKPD
jgi:predicted metalloprotease with PDZ domain